MRVVRHLQAFDGEIGLFINLLFLQFIDEAVRLPVLLSADHIDDLDRPQLLQRFRGIHQIFSGLPGIFESLRMCVQMRPFTDHEAVLFCAIFLSKVSLLCTRAEFRGTHDPEEHLPAKIPEEVLERIREIDSNKE